MTIGAIAGRSLVVRIHGIEATARGLGKRRAAITWGLLAGLGWGLGTPAQANGPGMFYAWRTLEMSTSGCVVLARRALERQNLTNIQAAGDSLSGQSSNATAALLCLEQDLNRSTVVVVVTSLDEAAAIALREALKAEF